MGSDFEAYVTQVGNLPAAFFVDLALVERAPVAELPVCATLFVKLNESGEDGLAGHLEYEALATLEERVLQAVENPRCVFAGRFTGNGVRSFYFYTSDAKAWSDRIAPLMMRHPEYSYRVAIADDPQWSHYLEFLYPPPFDRDLIQSRRVCERLRQEGDELTVAREVDHFACFPSREAASAYIADAAAHGFELRNTGVDESAELPYSVHVSRRDVPHEEAVADITLPLFEAAERHGGVYDGWGCATVT